ncbi:MAG: group II intron reverse transcriptase/maturase, partial [Muribaculaceae bacterium]|nr:group II intron reverse transcriptase/maturase [Muribaculaceae bacterium]
MPKENIYNDLYERAKNGEHFTDLMPLVLSRGNILLAYRNIKNNTGSNTAGTDKLTIADIGKLTSEEVTAKVRYIVSGTKRGYRPKPVRRKEVPKPNGKTRPLGIPCIWDRLIQQCFKQVLEPICEAHFSKHSYGFRPNCSVENAIADVHIRLQHSHLHYVIEFDIKGFFDN